MSLHPVTVHSEMMQRELQPVPLNETIRVLFIDEDESSGARLANFLQRHFKNFIMKQASNDFHDHAQALLEFRPDIVVGKGKGGIIVLRLVFSRHWLGATLLLAPAISPGIDDDIMTLPASIPFLVVAGNTDSCVPLRTLEGFWAMNDTRCKGGLRVHVVDDDQHLASLLDDNRPVPTEILGLGVPTLGSSGEAPGKRTLFEMVIECWELRRNVADGPYDHGGRLEHGLDDRPGTITSSSISRLRDTSTNSRLSGWLAWFAIGSRAWGNSPRPLSHAHLVDRDSSFIV